MDSKSYTRIITRSVLTMLLLLASYPFDVFQMDLPQLIPQLKRRVDVRNDISFGDRPFRRTSFGITSQNRNNYEFCLQKFLHIRSLFSRFSYDDFMWSKKNIKNLRASLCLGKLESPLEETLIGICKCHLAKNLHNFLKKILEDKELQQYNDRSVSRLRDWGYDYYMILGIKLALNIPGEVFSLSREEKDTLNRLLLLFPLDVSFNDCVKVLRESFKLRNDSMQKMSLPQALFIIHVNTSKPWFTYLYRDSYDRDKNFYMNCVVSAVKSVSEDILGMHFEYDGGFDNRLTMRQQTVLSFIEQFNVPATQEVIKGKED